MQGIQKLLVIAVFLVIVYNLGSALWYMLHKPEVQDDVSRTRVVRALTRRIAISIGLILLVAIALYTGILQSHGIRVGH